MDQKHGQRCATCYGRGMNGSKTAIERAFELAESGGPNSITEIKRALDSEGYSSAQILGPTLMRQLRKIIQAARERSASES